MNRKQMIIEYNDLKPYTILSLRLQHILLELIYVLLKVMHPTGILLIQFHKDTAHHVNKNTC